MDLGPHVVESATTSPAPDAVLVLGPPAASTGATPKVPVTLVLGVPVTRQAETAVDSPPGSGLVLGPPARASTSTGADVPPDMMLVIGRTARSSATTVAADTGGGDGRMVLTPSGWQPAQPRQLLTAAGWVSG